MSNLTEEEVQNILDLINKPIDKEQLIADGFLKKIGNSYYLGDKEKLPEEVSAKIKGLAQTSKGVRINFR